ncbi:hypothetical protein FQA39_LY12857 [Lamprigera yunnana]|nr:hypothetical protein FQA39_LY12857 [Lamprigera yunnana]
MVVLLMKFIKLMDMDMMRFLFQMDMIKLTLNSVNTSNSSRNKAVNELKSILIEYNKIKGACMDKRNINIVLFEPEIAQNVGAIMRTCVAIDATLHIIDPLGFPFDDRHLSRPSANEYKFVKMKRFDPFYFKIIKEQLDEEIRSGRFVFENDNYNEYVNPDLVDRVDEYIELLTKAVEKKGDDNRTFFLNDPSSDIYIGKFKNIIIELNKNSIDTSNRYKDLDVVKNKGKIFAKQSVTNKEKEEIAKFLEGKNYNNKDGLKATAQQQNYAKVGRMENVKDRYKVNKKWFLIAIGFSFVLMVIAIVLFVIF